MSDGLRAAFTEKWSDYMDRFAGVIQIDVTATEFILSPAYDLGLTEAELREANLAHLQNLS